MTIARHQEILVEKRYFEVSV